MSFGEQKFWDDRWSKETEPIEFYQEPEVITNLLNSLNISSRSIFLPGCGFSTLPQALVQLPTRPEITAVDWSPNVIQKQQKLHPGAIKFMTTDVRECTGLADNSFDLVLDKACLDSILCSSDDAEQQYIRTLSHYARLLCIGGYLLVISHASSEFRANLFAQLEQPLSLEKTLSLGRRNLSPFFK